MSQLESVFSGILQRDWRSPGPTIDAFIGSMVRPRRLPTSREVRVLTGPVGGGKSSGGFGATWVNAAKQPRWSDGVRRYRLLVLRDTYLNAWSQFVPFVEEWFPRNQPGVIYEGAKSGPLDVTLKFAWPGDVGDVDYMLQLRALGDHRTDNDIENFFRGLPTTDIWLEEGDMLPETVYDKAFTRLGRYPPRHTDGVGARDPTLFLISNQFLIGSWAYHRKMRGDWRPGIELFEQPGARSPKAENLHNLSEGYYEDIESKSDERTITRQVHNEHVLPNAGKAVYTEFRDLVHSGAVQLDPNLPLRIGMDGGLATLNPAAVIGQRALYRQLRCKSEVTVEHGTDAPGFAKLLNDELGKPIYSRWAGYRKSIICTVDQSAQFGNAPGTPNWIMAVEARTGLVIRPSRTNNLAPRRAALRSTMTSMLGGQPGLIVDKEGCPKLRMALGGLFHYPKIRAGLASRDADTPAKNHPYSDVAEACEYLAMDDEAYGEFEGGEQARTNAQQTTQREAISD
jgi:hypothetical protein